MTVPTTWCLVLQEQSVCASMPAVIKLPLVVLRGMQCPLVVGHMPTALVETAGEIGGGFGGWDVQQRGGSNFNTGNGRFTAPVSGFYHLTWQGYHYNDDNNTPNYHHMSFSRNGSVGDWTGRAPHGMWMHGTSNNHAHGVNQSLDLYLNSGEYSACMVHWSGGPSRIHGTHSHYSGYLIG